MMPPQKISQANLTTRRQHSVIVETRPKQENQQAVQARDLTRTPRVSHRDQSEDQIKFREHAGHGQMQDQDQHVCPTGPVSIYNSAYEISDHTSPQ